RDLEHRPEPDLERLPGLLQQRARREARLVVAVAALEQEATALGPHALAAAAGARRLATPARLDPIGAAGFLRRKPPVEYDRRLREIPPQIILVACHPPPPSRWLDRTQLRRSYGDRHGPKVRTNGHQGNDHRIID